MPVACLIGRGKVHTHPNASGMDVGGCVFVYVQKRVYMTSKVYTNNKKVQHHWCWTFLHGTELERAAPVRTLV